MLLYQPIALYWEQGRPDQRPVAEEACRQVARWQARHGQSCLPPQLDRPTQLERLAEPAQDLLDEAARLLGKEALPELFPELLAYHRQLSQQLERFAQLYPDQAELLEAWRSDLGDYQDAVGALVEQAWTDAAALLARVSGNLKLRRQAVERVRRQQGFSALAELDELAWSLQRGRADGRAVQQKLQTALMEVAIVLQRDFPDPRLRSEWADLWEPLSVELSGRLAGDLELALLPRLEDFFQRQAHWLQRARQRRDFSALWWGQLGADLLGWFAGWRLRESVSLLEARSWLAQDLSPWPEPDRQLRVSYLNQTEAWLLRVRDCLKDSARHQVGELVAFGDGLYDRWLWLFSKA